MPFPKKERIVKGRAQTRQRMAQRRGAHRQLVGCETNGTVAVNGVKNGQQV